MESADHQRILERVAVADELRRHHERLLEVERMANGCKGRERVWLFVVGVLAGALITGSALQITYAERITRVEENLKAQHAQLAQIATTVERLRGLSWGQP